MARTREPFESFREGMTVGHEAGRSEDLLYAVGFVVGFLWGAIFSAPRRGERVFERAAHVA